MCCDDGPTGESGSLQSAGDGGYTHKKERGRYVVRRHSSAPMRDKVCAVMSCEGHGGQIASERGLSVEHNVRLAARLTESRHMASVLLCLPIEATHYVRETLTGSSQPVLSAAP